MMTQYDNTNTFILFPVKERKTDKHPEFTGTININGVEYWLNGYNKAKGGVGGSVKPKEVRGETVAPAPVDLDDDIQF